MKKQQVDFLIITITDDEDAAIRKILGSMLELRHCSIWERKNLKIAYAQVGAMGTNIAQLITTVILMKEVETDKIILCGIAGGFERHGEKGKELKEDDCLRMGDLLIPRKVFPYESGKLYQKGKCGKKSKFKMVGEAEEFDSELWHAAKSFSKDAKWKNQIREKHPSINNFIPKIFCSSKSVIGCGEKLIATEHSFIRTSLIEKYGKYVLGVEMESYGVLCAINWFKKKLLLVKAASDPATGVKDDGEDKDKWHKYASSASAAFTVEFVKRYARCGENSFGKKDYMSSVKNIANSFEMNKPKPIFEYSIHLMRQSGEKGEASSRSRKYSLEDIIPANFERINYLQGGGGAGKSTIVRRMFCLACKKNIVPFYLDLKQYAKKSGDRKTSTNLKINIENVMEDVFLSCVNSPVISFDDFKMLLLETNILVLIDGINEVKSRTKNVLLEYFIELFNQQKIVLFITDRKSSSSVFPKMDNYFVGPLREDEVEKQYRKVFGKEKVSQLTVKQKELFSTPFFLNLAIQNKIPFQDSNNWSDAFNEFLQKHLSIHDEDILKISKETLSAINEETAEFEIQGFHKNIDNEIFSQLTCAGILSVADKAFTHDLWKDYFVSKYIAQKESLWRYEIFNSVTNYTASVEAIYLISQQLNDAQQKNKFLRIVYDWNYWVAVMCASRVNSSRIRTAILTAVLEKKFDYMPHTKIRIEKLLLEIQENIEKHYSIAKKRNDLFAYIKSLRKSSKDKWFNVWKTIFMKNTIKTRDIDYIVSDDPLIGWAVSNLFRRSKTTNIMRKKLCNIYRGKKRESIRWRIVHALGNKKAKDTDIKFLYEAFKKAQSKWIKYGVARSLIEIAAFSTAKDREKVIELIIKCVDNSIQTNNKTVLKEIVCSLAICIDKKSWEKEALKILNYIKSTINNGCFDNDIDFQIDDSINKIKKR